MVTRRVSDVLVVGSGVAGLSTALAAAGRPGTNQGCRVILLTAGDLGTDGATCMAQGGIAAAMDPEDHPAAHARDTAVAGEGVGDPERIDILTHEAPERIQDLLAWGAQFDRTPEGQLALGLEGAHSFRRILHAEGDQTGRELARVLRKQVLAHPRIEILEATQVLRLCVDPAVASRPTSVTGVMAERDGDQSLHLEAPVTVLATGGAGRLYRWTTNPVWAWGDGLALGIQAGAWLAGMEFVQFHPTALRVNADPLPLVTEALRGEGARLVDVYGRPLFEAGEGTEGGDLAPRHRVTRTLWRHQQEGGEAFLDARRAVGPAFPKRFPWIHRVCREFGIDPVRDLIPVTPAAHYLMGGIAADSDGRTSICGLRVAGEVAWTGVHGANRLASNSLLEGLVYGRRVGDSIRAAASQDEATAEAHPAALGPLARPFLMDEGSASQQTAVHGRGSTPSPRELEDQLRQVMWDHVGVERSGAGLREAQRRLAALAQMAADASGLQSSRIKVAQAMTQAALLRTETCGSHLRVDSEETFSHRSHTKQPQRGVSWMGS